VVLGLSIPLMALAPFKVRRREAPPRVACVCGPTADHYVGVMTAGTGRGINDPINLPLLLVLAKIENAAAETRGLKALFVDGGDERLKRRYMDSRWLHPSRRRLSDHGWGSGSSAKWFLAARQR
jgi:hypothetical protein